MKNITSKLIASFMPLALFTACSDLTLDQKPFQIKNGASSYNGGGSPWGGGSSGGGTGGGGGLTPPPNMSAMVQSISDSNPGMIQDCVGRPIANDFLITVVRALQRVDPRWGFMIKDGGARIPRDILAYAWSNEREGTNKFFVIDFVMSGCNNTPSAGDFTAPATNAEVGWIVHNLSTGTADNGVWSANP